MLKSLHIKHFTIITELQLELMAGLTVLTGETGAGKSILIDALQIALGGRGDISLIQNNQDRCEVTAIFDVSSIPIAQQWLINQALDEDSECLIRRIIASDGRSRSTINGRPCSLQQVRELGELLLHIHGQNQHSLLLKSEYQRELLDEFASHDNLCSLLQDTYEKWQKAQNELLACQGITKNHGIQKELYTFQLQELNELALQQDELEILKEEHQQLSHAEQWITHAQQCLLMLSDDDQYTALKTLHTAHQSLKNLPEKNTLIEQAKGLLHQAIIQIEEASSDIRHYLHGLEPDPQRLHWIEQRFADIHELARKHKVTPEELLDKQKELANALQTLCGMDDQIASLQHLMTELTATYTSYAHQLTQSRHLASESLSEAVTQHMQKLNMLQGKFLIKLIPQNEQTLYPHGQERVEFWVTTNPGLPLQPLHKVASGGELSRISLAIQVMTAQAATLPTLIFDEVDVGVGGSTAAMIGQQLRQLGEHAQVLCVTHLPQVAAQGHQHLHIRKRHEHENNTETQLCLLSPEERVKEIARMLGGLAVTDKTLAHAKEMLQFEECGE